MSNSATVNPAFNIIKQKTKKVRTRIQSLNRYDQVIGEVRGYCTGGSIDITNEDFVRRSANLDFVANEKLEVSKNSPFWIDKRLKIFTGVDDYKGNTHWFDHGIYIPTQIDVTASISGRTMSLSALDKMSLADNPVLETTKILVDTPLTDALKGLAELYGETKFMMDQIDYLLPYNIELLAGDSIQESMKTIATMYMNYDVFYNTAGYLVYEKQKNKVNDSPIWEFTGSNDFSIQRQVTADYTKIFNDFMVYGYYDDATEKQPSYHLTIEGSDYANHPFSVENMGRKHSLVIEEDTYTTEEQCIERAKYEKEQAENLINSFSITTVPIYQLNDVNRVVNVTDRGVVYTCLVDTINYPLDISSPMTIGCHEIFQ